MMALSSSAALNRPLTGRSSAIAPLRPRPAAARPARASIAIPRAIAAEVFQLATEATVKVGEVNAPEWALPAGVVVVTLLSILSGYLLKPGDDAAAEIRERDAQSGRFK